MYEARQTEATIRRVSDAPTTDNRRQDARYTVDLTVSLCSEHNFYAGFVENLSRGGVFVATHSIKAVGSVFDVSLTLPDGGEPIRVRGQVRWARAYVEDSDVPPGLGIQFMNLEAADLGRIEVFLSCRDPTFFYDD